MLRVCAGRGKHHNDKYGYDVLTDRYAADMVESDIIDLAKVMHSVLQNAVSIASMSLTTEVLITDILEKEKPAVPVAPEFWMGKSLV